MAEGTTAQAGQSNEQGQTGSAGEGGQGQAQTTNAESTPSSLLGGEATAGGNGKVEGATASWIENLPEDLRSSEVLKAFKDPSELAKAHLDGAAKIAELEGKIPKVPESADKYDISVPEGLPVDKDFVAAVKSWALESGMSQEQLTTFSAKYMEMQKAYLAEIAKNTKAQEDALKIEWGAKYDENLKLAQQAFRNPKFVADHETEYVLSRYGNDAVLVRIFNRLTKLVAEDEPPTGDGGVGESDKKTRQGKPMLSFPSMEKK